MSINFNSFPSWQHEAQTYSSHATDHATMGTVNEKAKMNETAEEIDNVVVGDEQGTVAERDNRSPFPPSTSPLPDDVTAIGGNEDTPHTMVVRPIRWQLCGNCGVKLEPEPALDIIQLKLRSSLFDADSIYVGDALSQVFKTTFPEEILEGSVLCHPCSLILKDLYIIWTSFTSKSVPNASLYKFLTDEGPSQAMKLIVPKKSPRKRLKLKIARRKQVTNSSTVRKRKSTRKFANKIESFDRGFDFENDFRNSEGSDGEIEDSARSCAAKRRGRTPKYHADILEQSDDDDVTEAKRPRRRKSAKTYQRIGSPAGGFDEEEDESDERYENVSDLGSEGQEEVANEEDEILGYKGSNYSSHKDTVAAGMGKPKKKRVSKRKFRPVVCLECGKRFLSTNGLTRHQLSIHLNIHGPFICKIEACGGKKFPDQKSLESHMNNHYGIKPFICDQCGWATTGETLLRSHLRVHLKPEEKDELKTKICEICGAKFIKNRDLSAHLIVHSDVKAFHCAYEGCEAKFKLRTKLNLHEKEVHLDIVEKHPCHRCGRVFNRKHNLKLHMERHDKYDRIGKGMRKSRDPPVRDKKIKKNITASLVEPSEIDHLEKGQCESSTMSPPDLLPYPPHFLAQSFHRL